MPDVCVLQGILLVYDIANRWSFEGIDRWIREIDEVWREERRKGNRGGERGGREIGERRVEDREGEERKGKERPCPIILNTPP